jgi:hypothetical protein
MPRKDTYIRVNISLTPNQKEKLAKANRDTGPVILSLSVNDLDENSPDHLMLTQSQYNTILRQGAKGHAVNVKLSKTQVKAHSKIIGGWLAAVAPLAMNMGGQFLGPILGKTGQYIAGLIPGMSGRGIDGEGFVDDMESLGGVISKGSKKAYGKSKKYFAGNGLYLPGTTQMSGRGIDGEGFVDDMESLGGVISKGSKKAYGKSKKYLVGGSQFTDDLESLYGKSKKYFAGKGLPMTAKRMPLSQNPFGVLFGNGLKEVKADVYNQAMLKLLEQIAKKNEIPQLVTQAVRQRANVPRLAGHGLYLPGN